MPWGVAVAAVVGGVAQNQAAKKGAKASGDATAMSVDEQRRQFDLTRQDMQPWLEQGQWGLEQQRRYLAGDTSGFMNSPDYKFAVEQGFKGLERSMASNLGTSSGGADADRIAFGQGLATQYGNNYFAKLQGLSGTGQQTATQLGQFGANAASNIGNAFMKDGQARASAYQAQGNAYANTANQLGQFAMYKWGSPNNAWGR